MNKTTKSQIKIIHTLLNQVGLYDIRRTLFLEVSGGRTDSSKSLTIAEATQLIKYLNSDESGGKMRRKIFALAYNAGFIWGDTDEDKKMNLIKINSFIKEKGTVKKDLHKMTNAELARTVSQFEQVVKHKKESHATKATKTLLEELNIGSSFRKTTKQH